MSVRKKRKTYRTLKSRKSMYGRMFILPWVIGFIMFFLSPLVQSVNYAFSTVRFDGSEYVAKFAGLKNFHYIFFESPTYVDRLTKTLSSFLYMIPLLFALSLILALLLNRDFRGRTFFRGIFFIPVIVSTGVVIDFIRKDAQALTLMSASQSGGNIYLRGLIDFNEIMNGLGIPVQAKELLMSFISQIYDLIWSCGIPAILFLAGLQSIPDSLYDVSKVEGATKWEEFWYVTIPMLGNTITLVLIYISIELFTNNNDVMEQAFISLQQQTYDYSSAMLWVFFALAGGALTIVLTLFNNLIMKKWR